jgi:hypothetical protein
VGRLPVRFGASKRALNYRVPCPLIKRALPYGAFSDPIATPSGGPRGPLQPSETGHFFYWCPSGARPGWPPPGGAAAPSGGRGRLAGLLQFVPARPAPFSLAAHCIETFF